jgi:hypothetical protein
MSSKISDQLKFYLGILKFSSTTHLLHSYLWCVTAGLYSAQGILWSTDTLLSGDSVNSGRCYAALTPYACAVTSCSNRSVASGVHCGVRIWLYTTQLCGKHISVAVNQSVTIEEAVFSVGDAPRLYNEDLKQLEFELSFGVGSSSGELSRELTSAKICEKT